MGQKEPEPILPQFHALYDSILKTVVKESVQKRNKPARHIFDKNGEKKPQYDCLFFYIFLNKAVPRKLQKEYRNELTTRRVTPSVWKKTRLDGISRLEHATNAFEVSAKYSPSSSITEHLLRYIKYAEKEKANLFGIKGHEEAVEALKKDALLPSAKRKLFWKLVDGTHPLLIPRENELDKIIGRAPPLSG
ncbi:hypothetical protein DJ030_06405 [bacterium endosymbiont of Escarpia laminata]|nr:MAG: hypothetical protein DJ030_06405 [bacterium endosymbiont of Escarpia laminata]